MMRNWRNNRLGMLVAFIAIALLSIVPSISHAMKANQSVAQWSAICSVNHNASVELPSDALPGSLPQPTNIDQHSDCGYCLLHFELALLLNLPNLGIVTIDSSADDAPVQSQFLRTFSIWASTQPRAPPRFS